MFKHVVDTLPEINKPLSGKYVKSFAYPTFKERAPHILQGIVDHLSDKNNFSNNYGADVQNELDIIASKLTELKLEMTSDQPLKTLAGNDRITNEVEAYNSCLKERQVQNKGKPVSWFQTDWLFAECYMYFKIYEIFYTSQTLNTHDPFLSSKIASLKGSEDPVLMHSEYLVNIKKAGKLNEENRKKHFTYLLKCMLWGNKADMSLSGGEVVSAASDTPAQMNKLDKYILVNNLEAVYKLLTQNVENGNIGVVLDNAGYELFNDLLIADFLIWLGIAKKITFHGKAIPWFVSDVTFQDFTQFPETLYKEIPSESIRILTNDWTKYINDKTWEIKCEPFWTLPFDYSQMHRLNPDLYSELAKNKLVIFKGDLNYRKLVGDIYWEPTTSFQHTLRGFEPTSLVALRTIKADTISGLEKGLYEKVTANDPNWLTTGEYGVIQLLEKK